MSRVRVYLPLTEAELSALAAGQDLSPRPAYAVTVRLASQSPGADVEELEYAAFVDAAAAASRRRTAAQASGGGDLGRRSTKRVVAAADVAPEAVTEPALPEGRTAAEVILTSAVPLRALASLHVDEQPGSTVDADLLWYDASEVLTVLQLLS